MSNHHTQINTFSPDHCATCGGVLLGGYYTILGSDERFCRTCFATRPRCHSCGAPMGDNYWKLHDGRLHCKRCHSSAVYDIHEAHTLYTETVQGVASHLGLRLNVGVDFRVIDAPTLRSHRHIPHPDPHTPAEQLRTLGLYERRGRMRVIYLLYGLPRLIFRTTVAHEYAHAWQTENCPLLRNNDLIEGFAEWVAFYHLLWLGATKAARRMLNTPHPYSSSLGHMFQLEKQFGKNGIIEYIKRAE